MLKLNVAVKGLLVCLFTAYQEVLSFAHCDLECVINFCTCKPSKPTFNLNPPDWIIAIFAIFGVVFCGVLIFILCTSCRKFCRRREEIRHTEEPTASVSIPPPYFVPSIPSAPPGNQFAEVSWRPYHYPPPMDQPPAYENIAMECLPPLDTFQSPGSVSKSNS